jgi:hypothetical protein
MTAGMPPRSRWNALSEADLVDAYRETAKADLEALGPSTGVPYAMHDELRQIRETVWALGLQLELVLRELATQRELLELLVAEAGDDPCDDCGRADGSHAWGTEH